MSHDANAARRLFVALQEKCSLNAIHDNGTDGYETEKERKGRGLECDYVAMWAAEGMVTNSRRMFLAVSRLFWAIIRAFWMSWME